MGQPGLYWTIFYNNILPIFLASGAGFALGRTLKPDIRAVSRLTFYIFSPTLVFTSIKNSQLSGAQVAQIALFVLVVVLSMAALTAGLGFSLRLERAVLASLIVASIFGNTGNYGLAINRFALGEDAFSVAVLYYAFSTVTVYTLGVLVASLGRRPIGGVLRHSLTLPTTFALIAASLLRFTGWALPDPVDRSLLLLSQGAVPVMLVVLGLQIASARSWPRARLGLVVLASGLHLVVTPLLALWLAGLMGLEGATRQAAILESAMPAAVIVTILAAEYELDGAFISSTVVLSTLLSPLTLTPLIAFLQR